MMIGLRYVFVSISCLSSLRSLFSLMMDDGFAVFSFVVHQGCLWFASERSCDNAIPPDKIYCDWFVPHSFSYSFEVIVCHFWYCPNLLLVRCSLQAIISSISFVGLFNTDERMVLMDL